MQSVAKLDIDMVSVHVRWLLPPLPGRNTGYMQLIKVKLPTHVAKVRSLIDWSASCVVAVGWSVGWFGRRADFMVGWLASFVGA